MSGARAQYFKKGISIPSRALYRYVGLFRACTLVIALLTLQKQTVSGHTQAIQANITRLDKGLRRTPELLQELKDVLGIVAAVRSGGMARELQYTDLLERFR